MNGCFEEILQKLAVVNYDNGHSFVERDRLDAIADILNGTKYKRVNSEGLFEMYSVDGILPENPIVISTHVDCVKAITKCFAVSCDNGLLLGTFDNLITNAMAVTLMVENQLSDNVVVAFTGDEEIDSRGTADVIAYMNKNNRQFKAIVLDVTDMGWDRGALFSVENNFWSDEFGRVTIQACKHCASNWVFVPSDVDDVPNYVPDQNLIRVEALCDESWEYDENDVECFSFCIPTKGEMHDNSGLLVRCESVDVYMDILAKILKCI